MLIVGPATGGTTGAWRIPDPLAAAPVLDRADAADQRRPPGRVQPMLCVHAGRIFVFGGTTVGGTDRALGDLWSIAVGGGEAGPWITHLVRRRQLRIGGRLLSTPDGLVLIGGASVPGALDPTVWRADLTRPRPSWEPLAALPIEAGRPGALWARADGTPEVLAWADRTAPRLLRYSADADRWTAGPPEPTAPNPPAEGEGLFLDDVFTVVGPAPLPPSEVVFRLGGVGHLAFLPALDLPTSADVELHQIRDDASTERWFPPGEPATASLRLGAGRFAPPGRRSAPSARYGVPGRLGWTPLRLRQVSLGRWDVPLALHLDDRVGVDPRLGRVLLPAALGAGQVTASFRVGRATALGAGFPAAATRPGGPVTAWVSPQRAGVPGTDGLPIVADLGTGLAAGLAAGSAAASDAGGGGGTADEPGGPGILLGILGSPRLPAQALALPPDGTLAVWPVETGGLPFLRAEDGVSLTLSERPADGDTDPGAGPAWTFTGLSTAGIIELVAAAGRLDLRWCTLAAPGLAALTVAGAAHASALLRRTLPTPTVHVHLTQCRVGRVELPPWALLTADGCTFDAGARGDVAIGAAGADVRLTHCTVNGRTLAGRLAASSCVLGAPISCDRPDLGWLRHCVRAPGGRPPTGYRTIVHRASFGSVDPNHPLHLALADNNPDDVRSAGEAGRTPGAHATLAARLRELTERAEDFLPLGLVPHHVDAAVADLGRLR
ncbi:hypothetical protein [Cryptosporangium minutisporangium]|uniref:Uncharacterized protein n=1 Tax=Cryptosporangium minutisporangium TaxID=113569 RepID=A0ABP6T116_9ACTN